MPSAHRQQTISFCAQATIFYKWVRKRYRILQKGWRMCLGNSRRETHRISKQKRFPAWPGVGVRQSTTVMA